MNVKITGLKKLDITRLETYIAAQLESDVLAYGLDYNFDFYDQGCCNEIAAVNTLVRVALVSDYNHLLIANTKLYAANTKADLLPELENNPFNGDTIYLEVLESDEK